MNIRTYYINLNRSPERDAYMTHQLNKLGLIATRIEAIDGSALDPEHLTSVINRQSLADHFMAPKTGEIGAFESHKLSWELISQQEEDYAFIVEDDIRVDPSLLIDLPLLIESITPDDIIDVSGRAGFLSNTRKEIGQELNLTRFSTPPLGMTGKIIGKGAARKLLDCMSSYTAPVDVMVQKVYLHNIPIYSVNKIYLSHIDHELGGTTIQTKNLSVVKKIFRELKRPFWRLSIKFCNFIHQSNK